MVMAGVAVDACRQINAASVEDLVTGRFSARREEARAGDEEDVAVEEEEEAVVVEVKEQEVRFSLLHWLSGAALQYFMLVHCIFGSVLLLYLVVTVAP